jgi:acetoin utilization protein AcuB
MLVKDYMSTPAIAVPPDMPFREALKLMQTRKIRRLPVIENDNRLVGIVSERDLLHAAPSPATSLTVWEMNYLLWRLRVCDVMTAKVHTVSPTTPLQVAAQMMVDLKIGGLPVVDDKKHVVGVITETDIFKAFVAVLNQK